MQPIKLLQSLKSEMIEYISSKYPFLERGREDLNRQLLDLMSREGVLFQDPVIQLVRGRKSQVSYDAGFSASVSAIQQAKLPMPYTHQVKAWSRIQKDLPTVIATGTGSGKSECFMYPIIDGLVSSGFPKNPGKLGAIVIYPMNALVEDQFFRFLQLTEGTGIKVGIYNGTYNRLSKASKAKILTKAKESNKHIEESTFFVDPSNPASYPHILLTNYKMLEYMLLRTSDQRMFANVDLKYLVLDEAHSYTGTLGLEISCLLARLRVHVGAGSDQFVPIATSATLAQGAASLTEEEATTAKAKHKGAMREFFSQLFNRDFGLSGDEKEDGWLIEDDFLDHPKTDLSVIKELLRPSVVDVKKALALPFSEGLAELCRIFFGLRIEDGVEIGTAKAFYDHWAKLLYPKMQGAAAQLAKIISIDPETAREDRVVPYNVSLQRFKSQTGGEAPHFDALLILASQAYEKAPFPSLGLRLHCFTRSEPRVYWTLDGKQLLDDGGVETVGVPTGAFVSCRKCGHMAWAGLYTPGSGPGDVGTFDRLPMFYEDAKFADGQKVIVLHRPEDVQSEVCDRKDWKSELVRIDPRGASRDIRFINRGEPTGHDIFVRINRKLDGDKPSDDMAQCPSCGATSSKDEPPVLMTPRSGAATDISVYSASLMTNLDLADERKLLVFCDNRQETAFLSGFLTDRHRRFNLRRAIASFLNAGVSDGASKWRLIAEIDPDEQPKGHKYDFAARILLSIKEGRYFGKDALPNRLRIHRRFLTEIMPRDVLEVDYRDRKDPESDQINDWKNWLLGNISLGESSAKQEARAELDEVELFDTDRGQWCLRTLHEVILFELSAMLGREGNLKALGLATWTVPALKMEDFESWAKDHPELNIGGMGLMIISQWLMNKLADNGQWQGVDQSSRRHLLRKRGKNDLIGLESFFGKGFNSEKGISKHSQIGRMLLHFGSDAALAAWSKSKPWLELIDKGPLKKAILISPQDNIPRLATSRTSILANPLRYRGSVSGVLFAMDPSIDLSGQPTGRKGDVWQRWDTVLHTYYRSLYQRSFAEESRLVRAHEHNGMIGGEVASEVIQRFETNEINTLVATPTLEMGVDLPDLPIVIHRSVPPDASNYAQRAGRAGRGPKRALIITHCGFGSHDLNFYQDPPQMVSGEILPPGLPRENISIIERHVQSLVLEVLAKTLGGASEPIRMSWWGDLVNLNDLRNEVLKFAGAGDEFPESKPANWRQCAMQRKSMIHECLAAFIGVLRAGLWKDLSPSRVDDMSRRILAKGDVSSWCDTFNRELDGFVEKAKAAVVDFSSWAQKVRVADKRVEQENQRQYWRAYKVAQLYLTRNDQNYPLSYLGMVGFLPNFDFPGKSIRFVGVMPQFMQTKQQYARSDNQFLSFSRGAALALREFAPEQKVYGQGFIYSVDRYEADTREEDSGKAWGVCTAGCSELSVPGAEQCQFCGSDLVCGGTEGGNLPKLVEISGVQGIQASVISDGESKRTFNRMVREIRHLGIPAPDDRFISVNDERISWQIHTSIDRQVKTVTMLSGSVVAVSEGKQTLAITPVYKEVTEGASRVFKVKASLNANDEDQKIKYEEFLPAIWGKGQALLVTCPFSVADMHGWIRREDSEPETLESYYKTLGQLVSRAASRVLRLNRRKASLQFLDHQIKESSGAGAPRIKDRALLILDTDEGGSGVIEVLWDYWDQIMDECDRLVAKHCCIDGCYDCIFSYDNQYDHAKIRKSLFYTESKKVPDGRDVALFQMLKKLKDGRQAIRHVDAGRESPTDSSSPGEKALEDFLRLRYPNLRRTQSSVNDINGREITRPDFILETSGGMDITLYVDGWSFHRTTLKADVSKRNRVALQGGVVAAFPAAILVPKRKDDILKEFIDWALKKSDRRFEVLTKKSTVIDVKLNQEEFRRIHSAVLKTDGWQPVDKDALKLRAIDSITSEELKRRIDRMEIKHWPLAVQRSYLVWPVFGKELEAKDNKEVWEAVLLLQAAFAFWGFSNILISVVE